MLSFGRIRPRNELVMAGLLVGLALLPPGCEIGAVGGEEDVTDADSELELRRGGNCADHRDNDGDGFCDVLSSYCIDGAKPGDSDCTSKNAVERSSAACRPSTEVCDGKDNDCDGAVDEGNVCCVPATCSAGLCGTVADGCGGQLDCGTCPPVCGDKTCSAGETCASCAGDCCPPVCGDKTCSAGETCASCASDCCPPPGLIGAFPGAQGGGALARGGRGGRVIEVTNLNDSGAGSLRACVEASGARTCVFRTSGVINVLSDLRITNPYVTIAGQTAPPPGIGLFGGHSAPDTLMFNIQTHDVVVRYVREWKGAVAGDTPAVGGGGYNVQIYGGGYNIIFDHCTLAYATGKAFGIWASAGDAVGPRNITLQYSIVGDGMKSPTDGQSGNPIITGGCGTGNSECPTTNYPDHQTDIDFHHNLILHGSKRMPLFKSKSGRFVNNIVYDWVFSPMNLSGGVSVDVIGNVWQPGSWTDTGAARREISVAVNGNNTTASGSPSVYVRGNKSSWHTTNQSDSGATQWAALTAQVPNESVLEWNVAGGAQPLPAAYQRSEPLAAATSWNGSLLSQTSAGIPITAEPADALDTVLLPVLGAYRTLDGSGTGAWVMVRDATDTYLVNSYVSRTGTTDYETSFPAGLPTLAQRSAANPDADHDGMPDPWESARGLNPNDPSDGNLVQADGYTNLERYLNGQ